MVTSDIDHFWEAYDKITGTRDSAAQYDFLNRLFLEKGSPGLKAIMEVRGYTAASYIHAIRRFPQFWQSIRPNTLKAKELAGEIETEIQKLKALYPGLKPAQIYFTMGALRTNGTTLKDMVLIGSELALADRQTLAAEFTGDYAHLPPFFTTNPVSHIVFGNMHEYIHTQQKTTIADNLLGQCLLEGAAEFMAVLTTEKPSATPALAYGKEHEEKVRARFAQQMFNPFTGFWLYSNAANEFQTRDMGYFTGYAICEKYYAKASDKKLAIQAMIELDYNDPAALRKFVDRSGYFRVPLKKLEKQYRKSQPLVTGIREFRNKDKAVSPGLARITVSFSTPMNRRARNFELGPLGESNLLRVQNFIGFSEDGRSASFEVALLPNRRYQLLLGSGFRSEADISMKPFLIDFSTGDR